MILVDEGKPAAEILPVAELRAYLRLGSGFELAQDPDEDRALVGFLRAAMSVIEGRTGKVLLRRPYRMMLNNWRDDMAQPLPMAPVSEILSVELADADGRVSVLAPAAYRLVADPMRPFLRPRGACLPPVHDGGSVTVRFVAGFGATWDEVPADLAQAVIALAATYYDERGAAPQPNVLPMGISALIERWRSVRTLAGRGAR